MRATEEGERLAQLQRIITRLLDPEHEGTAGTFTIHRGKGRGQVRIEAELSAPERMKVETTADRAAAAFAALGLDIEQKDSEA